MGLGEATESSIREEERTVDLLVGTTAVESPMEATAAVFLDDRDQARSNAIGYA
jgi:hypothetical protein